MWYCIHGFRVLLNAAFISLCFLVHVSCFLFFKQPILIDNVSYVHLLLEAHADSCSTSQDVYLLLLFFLHIVFCCSITPWWPKSLARRPSCIYWTMLISPRWDRCNLECRSCRKSCRLWLCMGMNSTTWNSIFKNKFVSNLLIFLVIYLSKESYLKKYFLYWLHGTRRASPVAAAATDVGSLAVTKTKRWQISKTIKGERLC